VSNPKVFEFAKEIGMTPLALMDRIKEWKLPIKNHMAEIEPAVLDVIKTKLNENESSADEGSAKKTTTKRPRAKAAVKKSASSSKPPPRAENAKPLTTSKAVLSKPSVAAKVVDAEESPEPVSKGVIRRKTADLDLKAKIISKPEVEDPVIEKVEMRPEPKLEPIEVAKMSPAAVQPAPASVHVAQSVPTEAAPSVPAQTPLPSRKKEVAIGDSGISSSTTVKRNIIGRMDLSRVQAPQGSQGGYQGGGYQGNRPMSGPRSANAPRPGGPGAAPGGFRPQGAGGGRNIRAGFVAAETIPDPQVAHFGVDARRDHDKKARRFGTAAQPPPAPGINAREKEQTEILQSFNAVEFRKREMVFQPKKKQTIMNREAMKTQITKPKASKRVLKVNNKMKLSDAAAEMGLKAAQLTKALMQNGVMATINTDLDFETLALVVTEFGWEAQNTFKTAEEVAVDTAFGDLSSELVTRPPVITVMGHVDHGKTSLLDAIRNSSVASGEAGGITQHIGAYSVKTADGSLLTFLDTPGHEAFTQMRARGANATDIAVIVVAADDGMMPQTAEAINHAKAAKVPIIVAVNKIDKPGANPEKIKQQLTELEIVPEEWGGTTIFCEVSALKRTGIDKLLENIKLLAEVGELKANPNRSGTGIVIEAKLEKGKGPVATILVKDGFVEVGQYIVAGTMKGKVKSLVNDKGERIQKVLPGMPAEVLGLEGVPAAGDRFDITKDEKTSEEVVEIRRQKARDAQETTKKLTLEDLFARVTGGEVKDFNIVLKADVHGSLEAIMGMLNKLTSQEVKNKVIHSAVGGVNENDVLLAHTAKGIVIGFNVRPDSNAQAKAKEIGVDIRTYTIVYEMIDDVKKAMQGLLAPQVVEKVMGAAEVRNIFSVPKLGTIAGCFVTSGKVQRSNMLRLVRQGKIIYEGKVVSLKRFKDDAREVAEGFECGIGIENFNDIKVGDIIEAYVKEEIARELTPLQTTSP
jgi:translation initiation factor IF-2